MKSLKIWSVLLMSTLLFGLTSCLNGSDDSSSNYQQGVVRVQNSLGTTYFVAKNGTKLIPSTTSMQNVESNYKFTAQSGLAYIVYSTSTSSSSSTTSGTISIELSYAVSIQGTSEVVNTVGDSNDSIATRPILELSALSTSSDDRMLLYDNSTLLMGINYSFSKPAHSFTLVFYPNDVKSEETTMKVYLRHRSSDTGSTYTSYMYAGQAPSLFYHSFDISNMVSLFKAKAGKTPTDIEVVTDANDTSATELPTSKKSYTIKYTTTTE
jgi:hypothetical protein